MWIYGYIGLHIILESEVFDYEEGAKNMKYEFDAEIKRLEGKIKWSVFYFPESAEECFGIKGNIPVKITVDGHPFDHTLLSSRNGHYIVYNEFIRRAVGKEMGDSIHVTLEKDEKPRIFTVPVSHRKPVICENI